MSKIFCGNSDCGAYLGSMGADSCVHCGWIEPDAIEAAATEPLLQRIAELEQRNRDLFDDVQRFRKHAMNEKAARMELERQLEEARTVLKETGLLLHHFWCDVQMSDYSFARLSDGMEAIGAAMQKGQS